MNETSIHPDDVLQSLLSTAPRADREKRLKALHEICREHYSRHEGNFRDFSLPTLGRLCEEARLFKARVLYNAASRQYVDLISAWAAFSGTTLEKEPKEEKSYEGKYPYLMRIPDPAIRTLIQAALAHRDELIVQVNILKARTNITIDQRPVRSVYQSPEHTNVVETGPKLTESERAALEVAISQKFLAGEGWHEGTHGEVLNGATRVLYGVGYLTAIRKVLKR